MSTRAFVPRDEVTASDPPGGPSRLPDHNGRLAVFDLDRTLLPGSSLSLFGRALHRAGMVGSRRLAGYLAREAVFVRRAKGCPRPTGCWPRCWPMWPIARPPHFSMWRKDWVRTWPAPPAPAPGGSSTATSPPGTSASSRRPALSRWSTRRPGPSGPSEPSGREPRSTTAGSPAGSTGRSATAGAAGRPVAVNPDRRLRREATTQGWPVLTF